MPYIIVPMAMKRAACMLGHFPLPQVIAGKNGSAPSISICESVSPTIASELSTYSLRKSSPSALRPASAQRSAFVRPTKKPRKAAVLLRAHEVDAVGAGVQLEVD